MNGKQVDKRDNNNNKMILKRLFFNDDQKFKGNSFTLIAPDSQNNIVLITFFSKGDN